MMSKLASRVFCSWSPEKYHFERKLMIINDCSLTNSSLSISTPYIRLVKFQLVREILDVYVSACVLAGKLFLLFFLVLLYFS